MSDETPSAGVTRRQLTRISAWTVPVFLLTTAVPLVAASGDPDISLSVQIFEVETGEQVPLIFAITVGGAPFTGGVTAGLLGASGIARWLDEDGEPVDGDIILGQAAGGEFFVWVDVVGHGAFTVNVTVGTTMRQFVVEFTTVP